MAIREIVTHTGRALVIAGAVFAVASMGAPQPAHAIDTGTAVGIGLGAAALGAAIGSTANPYYAQPAYNPYYAAPAPGYYAPAPGYYPQTRQCWDGYYRRYYAC